jgi:hypothetical protein
MDTLRAAVTMPADPLRLLLLAALTLASGLGDAHGFVHAARMWQDGRLVARELAHSAAGFALGVGCYWIAVRDLVRAGVLSAEVQTLVWFGVTIVGIALASGRILSWRAIDQVVALGVLTGLGFLLVRNG